MSDQARPVVARLFEELADAIEGKTKGGGAQSRAAIGVTVMGSEHGPAEIVKGAGLAQSANPGIEVVLIGPADLGGAVAPAGVRVVPAVDEADQHRQMERLLDAGEIDACVTMHYNFPVGVATVGRVVTPGRGKPMYLATTTGTASVDRVEGMVRNAVYGIAAAKACGIERPTVGILNVDGARQVERALRRISEAGYALEFAESARADGGAVMRGNDLLMGVPDVMVTDTLTGNLLMKMFSSYSTGGDYEATGWGYGPGVGEGYGRIIMILSRASGAPVVAGAIAYAAELVRGGLVKVANAEFAAARAAGWPGGRDKGAGAGTGVAPGSAPGSGPGSVPGSTPGGEPVPAPSPAQGEVAAPPAKVVTAEIAGVDILELENAVRVLWAAGIYAESGMGCTGPIVMVSPEDRERAVEALKQAQYL